MEKRFVIFIVLSLAILTGYQLIKTMIAPERPAIVDLDDGANDEPPKAHDDPADRPPTEPVPDKPPTAVTSDPDPSSTPDPSEGPQNRASSDTVVTAPTEWPAFWISRGSYQPGDGPPILVTWNARGATVERIELTARDGNGRLRYRELLDRSGYLGHLALT